MADDLNHMVKTEDGKLRCPLAGCQWYEPIEDHVHSFEPVGLLVDRCIVNKCHEERYA